MSFNVRKQTFWHVRPKQTQINLRIIRAVWSVFFVTAPHEETLIRWLSKMRPVKIQIRLRECAVWFESSLCAMSEDTFFWTLQLIHNKGRWVFITKTCYCNVKEEKRKKKKKKKKKKKERRLCKRFWHVNRLSYQHLERDPYGKLRNIRECRRNSIFILSR